MCYDACSTANNGVCEDGGIGDAKFLNNSGNATFVNPGLTQGGAWQILLATSYDVIHKEASNECVARRLKMRVTTWWVMSAKGVYHRDTQMFLAKSYDAMQLINEVLNPVSGLTTPDPPEFSPSINHGP